MAYGVKLEGDDFGEDYEEDYRQFPFIYAHDKKHRNAWRLTMLGAVSAIYWYNLYYPAHVVKGKIYIIIPIRLPYPPGFKKAKNQGPVESKEKKKKKCTIL